MNITVYPGANPGNDPALMVAVRKLGRWNGRNGHGLVHGGSKTGLMRVLAESALQAGIVFADDLAAIVDVLENSAKSGKDA